jgi:hypothetical protein
MYVKPFPTYKFRADKIIISSASIKKDMNSILMRVGIYKYSIDFVFNQFIISKLYSKEIQRNSH